MIWMSGQYCESPVYLFSEHDPCKPMGQGYGAQRNDARRPPGNSRAMTVGDGEYATKLSLCNALGSNWGEAGQIIAGGELERWLQRALSDDETAESLKEVMLSASVLSDSEERLTAKTEAGAHS